MKTSVTVVFVLLFGIVLGVYLYFGASSTKNPWNLEIQSSNLYKGPQPLEDKDIINLIQIQNLSKNVQMTLVNEEGNWYIQFPVRSRADNRILDALAASLKFATRTKRIPKEKDWNEYGLDKPSIKIGIETNRGKQREFLCFGSSTPIGDMIFTRWEGHEYYFLVNAAVKRAFEVSMYSLRLKQLIQTPLEEISKMHVRVAARDYELALSDGRWFWMEPILILGEPASKEQIQSFLRGLGDLYIKEFLDDEKKDGRALGFSLLGDFIQLWGKSDKPETIQIGDQVLTKDSVYAKREGEAAAFFISSTHLGKFFETVETVAGQVSNHLVSSPASGGS